jgi:hypothetical protein
MVNVVRTILIGLVLLCAAQAQTAAILPLREVRAGMVATGRTVFAGGRIEEFRCEILGVLENAGPKQSIILARLSGGPLAETGVLQGMSGSPVYYQGRLMGAVALSFPFSKEPVAGIRPIEEMLANDPAPRRAAGGQDPFRPAALPARQEVQVGPSKLVEIATPFWLSGFTRAAVEHFSPALRAAGLEPVQGISGGGKPAPPAAGVRLEPGSMISVQLITGDMAVGADGTVTHVDGRKVYAFGHRFLATGDTEMPFARAEVVTLLPSLNSSFKISTPREWMGTITQDRNTALAGELGRQARLLPVAVRVRSRTPIAREWSYRMNVVQDRLFTPLLLQMAIFSAIDATERTSGLSTITLRGRMQVAGAGTVPFDNLYAAEMGAPQQAAAAIAAPVAAVLQSGFEGLAIESLDLDLDISNEKAQLQLDGVWPSRREVRPGEEVEITALFTGERGQEVTRTAKYRVPLGAPAGPLYFTVTDGPSANLAEYRQFLLAPPRSPEQLKAFLLGLHANDRAYVRVWRTQPTMQVQGENLPAPPASMAAVLSKTASQQPNSLVAELRMAPAAYLFSGSKTIQVEVKE